MVIKQQPELRAAFPISQTSACKCELAGNKRFPVDGRTDPTNRCLKEGEDLDMHLGTPC